MLRTIYFDFLKQVMYITCMKKIILMTILSLSMVSILFAAKLGTLQGVLVPEMIQVSGDELYVLDGATIYVYSLKDLSLLRQFGRKGEGPGELKVMAAFQNNFKVYPDYVFVQGFGKIIFFSKKGQLIREKKINRRLIKILPLKDKYVIKSWGFEAEDKVTYWAIKLWDSQMEELKELYRQKFPLQIQKSPADIPMIPETLNFQVYEDKIFVEESPAGFLIEVFDAMGEKLYRIEKKYEKQSINDEFKKTALDHLKEDYVQKKVNFFIPADIMEAGWDEFKKWANLIYPDFIPPIKNLVVDNNKIYIQTFKCKGDKQEYIVMDLKGGNQKNVHLPVVQSSSFASEMLGLGLTFYAIDNNRFVYLLENQEEWEVHQILL